MNFNLRKLQDIDRINEASAAVEHVTVIEAGFIGLEMGRTSYFAARTLVNNGFDARSILGGANHQL